MDGQECDRAQTEQGRCVVRSLMARQLLVEMGTPVKPCSRVDLRMVEAPPSSRPKEDSRNKRAKNDTKEDEIEKESEPKKIKKIYLRAVTTRRTT